MNPALLILALTATALSSYDRREPEFPWTREQRMLYPVQFRVTVNLR